MNKYFEDFGPIQDTFAELPEIPRLVRSKDSGDKIYLIHEGKKHWITSPEVLNELGFAFGQEKFIDREILQKFLSGEPIKMDNVSQFKTPDESDPYPSEGVAPFEASDSVKLGSEVEEGVILTPAHPEEGKPHTIIQGLTSIIIPAWFNSYQMFHLTGDCIGNIRTYTNKEKTPYEIILVENGKGVESFKDREKDCYADKIIFNEENQGYTKAMNQGIRVAQGEYICLMSNDVLVYDHWLEDFLEALNELDVVMATPMYGMPYARGVEANQLRTEGFSDFQDFSCAVVKRVVFEKVGLLDEQFFLYVSDVDFLKRVKDAGFKLASTKKVNTHHLISATDIDKKSDIMNDEKEKFKLKWEK